MRIDWNKATEVPDAGQAPAAGSQSAAVASATQGSDTAVLSPDQVRVQDLAAKVNQLPEIRQEKVAALGREIRSGNYRVSPEQTADALFSDLVSRAAA